MAPSFWKLPLGFHVHLGECDLGQLLAILGRSVLRRFLDSALTLNSEYVFSSQNCLNSYQYIIVSKLVIMIIKTGPMLNYVAPSSPLFSVPFAMSIGTVVVIATTKVIEVRRILI